MAEKTFMTLCLLENRPSLLSPAGVVCGLGGQPLNVLGETELRVQRAGPITVLVTRGLPHELLLGSDSIERGQGVMDYRNEQLLWYGTKYPLVRYTDSPGSVAAISVQNTTGYCAIDEVIRSYGDVFSDSNPTLGYCDQYECSIDTEGAPPLRQRAYRAPLAKREAIEKQIKEMLDAGVIEPSASPWASPVTLVPKSDGSLRFCVDYRGLNNVTRKDRYPSVLIQDIFDQLDGATIFTTLDLQSGYWQLAVAPEDQPKTAFVCHRGQFSFRRMPFGLCNAPAVFQRAMDGVLHGLLGRCCYVYIDDIVIFSRDPEEHARHLAQVLTRLRQAGLRAKTKKCHFAKAEVPLLGYIVNRHGIRPNPDKTEAIANMKTPTSIQELRRFLGMCGYYRQAIDHFAEVAQPLVELTRKNVTWEWTVKRERAFRTLQQMLLGDNVLAYPRLDRPYRLYTDASGYCVGGVLTQEDDQGCERVIQYVSHQLNESEQKWATIEREAYAIVYCLKKLRPYLWGADFEILTDHKPLRALFLSEVANTKVQRWAVLIAEFGAPIAYREGKNNIRADFLSRLRPVEVDVIDTSGHLEPQTDMVRWTLPLVYDGIDQTQLGVEQQKEFADLWQQAADWDNEDYQVREGILFSCRRPGARQALYPRVVLPKCWRNQVITRCHEQKGHTGVWRTLCSLREAYVWPGMQRQVKDYVRACGICQVHKAIPQTAPYTRMPDPCYPHQVVGMDLTGPFVRSERGHVYLFNLIDHLTGWADCYPISNKKGETIADVLQKEYFPRYGAPEILISDNGTEFANASVASLCRACDVDHRTTTPYRPQSNSKIERFHRTLKGLLERLMTVSKSNWEKQLGPALIAYRSTVTGATGYTPFQGLYGRQMRVPLTRALRERPADVEALNDDRVAALARVWQGAREVLRQERETNEAQQRRKRLCGELTVGDGVIILIPGMKRTFHPRWDARWEVIRARHPVYWIRHLPSGREKVLHRDKLRWVPPNVDWQPVPYQDMEATEPAPETQRKPEKPRQQQAPLPLFGYGEEAMDLNDDSLPLVQGVDQNTTTPTLGTSVIIANAPTGNTSHDGPTGIPVNTLVPTGVNIQRRYPKRKRQPPRYLGWEDQETKRGRFAALDYYCGYSRPAAWLHCTPPRIRITRGPGNCRTGWT